MTKSCHARRPPATWPSLCNRSVPMCGTRGRWRTTRPRGYGARSGRRWVLINDEKWGWGTRNPATVDKHAQSTDQARTTISIETEAREDAEMRRGEWERERGGKMEGALHSDHLLGFHMYWVFVWVYGLDTWNGLIPHSFQISLCFLFEKHHAIPDQAIGQVLASVGWSACIVIRN